MSAAGGGRSERGADRDIGISHAAAAAFARDGYEGTTMQAIADRAGVSVGLLYRCAPSKEALFAAAFERVARSALRRLTDRLEPAPDVDAQLRVGAAWLAEELADGEWPAMARQAWMAADSSPPIRCALERQARDLDELATTWAQQALDGDPAETRDAESLAQAARLLLDGAIGHVSERRSRGQEWVVAHAAAALLRLALLGATRPGRDPSTPPERG